MKNFLRAFSEPAFLFLWLGEIFTQISFNIFCFFTIIIVFSLTKSNTAVSGVVIAFTAPAILFGILAGVYVDHWDKKKVLISTNVLRALLLVMLAFFHTNVVVIYIVVFLVAFITQFFIPAETPMIPLVVSKDLLLSANALFGLGIFGSILIAYILSGPMLILLGEVNELFVLAALFIISAGFISLIRYKKNKSPETTAHLTSELQISKEVKHTLQLLLKSKEIYSSLFLLALSQILILIIATVTPGYADKVLHMDLQRFPIFFVTPAALGMLTGAALLIHYFHDADKNKTVILGLFLSAIAMCLLPFAQLIASKEVVHTINSYIPHVLDVTNIHILVVLAFFLGISNALVFVPCNTILQEETSDEFRGKIYGVLNALVGLFSLIPIVIVGRLSDTLGVGNVIIGIGITLLLIGVARIFSR